MLPASVTSHSLLAISSPRLPTLSLKLLSFLGTLAVPPRGADDGISAVPMMERPKKEIDFESGADVSGWGLRAAISACSGWVRVRSGLVNLKGGFSSLGFIKTVLQKKDGKRIGIE